MKLKHQISSIFGLFEEGKRFSRDKHLSLFISMCLHDGYIHSNAFQCQNVNSSRQSDHNSHHTRRGTVDGKSVVYCAGSQRQSPLTMGLRRDCSVSLFHPTEHKWEQNLRKVHGTHCERPGGHWMMHCRLIKTCLPHSNPRLTNLTASTGIKCS